MADKMMRIAGRTSGGVAVPMKASANGDISTTRVWKREWITIETGVEIRNTAVHNCPAIDVSDVPTFSLRILNRLGVPITIMFLTDVNTTNGYGIAGNDGTDLTMTIQPANAYVIITPEDMPLLNYIRYLRIAVRAASTPSSGIFEAYMVSVK